MSSRDTRIPVEVVQIGRVTVRIFDMEEYLLQNVKGHQGEKSTQPSPSLSTNQETKTPGRGYTPFPKQKPTARYNWHSGINRNKESA